MRALVRLLVSFVLVASMAAAQEITGAILGLIEDPSGAVVPGASVTVTNTDRNSILRTVKTDSDGTYVAPLLPIGHYSVSVEVQGFKKAIRTGIELNVNEKLAVNVALELGDVRQEVSVEAEPPRVDLQSATAQSLISGDQVRELALNNRNYEQLVSLMPGVVFFGDDQIYVGVSNPSGQSNQVRFSINGSRPSQNAWTIDGADNVDRGSNLTLLSYPSVDAIAEFRVLRGQYSAEFGRDAGGMINVITRSGTNRFHGDAYEFFRNDVLSANTFFNNAGRIPRPPLRYNNFGYTLGGPVYIPGKYNKDHSKTFFFFSQEFRRVITYASAIGTGPTAQEKQGIFSNPVCVAVDAAGACAQTATQISNFNPVAAQYVKDIFSKIPDANANHQLFLALRNVFNFRQELYKLDHRFSERWNVSGRFIKDTIPTEEPRGLFTGSGLPNVSNTSTDSPGKGVVVRATASLTPTLLNEAGYSWSWGGIISTPTGLGVSANSPSVKPVLPFPVTLGRVPSLNFGGAISTLTGFGPYDQRNVNQNWFDNLTKIAGKHTLKAGASIIRYSKVENQGTNNVGTFTFATTPRPTGASTLQQAWANFLLGNVATFTQTARDITPSIRVNQFEFYLQDEFRLRKNLVVSIGARYSNFRQPYDKAGYLNNFDPSRYDPARAPQLDSAGNLVPGTGDPLNGLIVQGKNSPYGNKVGNENNLDLAPRFGFSWDPFGRGRTAIRGGYGVAYDFSQVGVYEGPITGNPSSVQTVSIVNTRLENPASSGTVAVATAPPALTGLPLPYNTPYVQQWSLDVQHELPGKVIAQVGYYGSKGTHLFGQIDINQVRPGLAVAAGLQDPNQPILRGASSNRLNLIRPYRGYNAINAVQTVFNSSYHGLQTALERRFGGSFINVAYTWSKVITDAGTDLVAPMNTYDRSQDRGLAPFDRRHVFTANWNYALPWFLRRKDLVGQAAGGWQLSGIATFNSGLPLTVTSGTLGTDPAGLGFLGSSASGGRPDQTCSASDNAPQTVAQWFNTSCFRDVPNGQVRTGNAGRGTVTGPGIHRWDLSAIKNFALRENLRLQFRAEAFNVFNRTNFSTVSTALGATNFGNVTASRDPRTLQLALKLYW